MGFFRHARLIGTLLLGLQAFALGQGAAPARTECTCTHAPGEHCNCPMHARSQAAIDEAKLPPCHRHHAKSQPAKPLTHDAPCLELGCSAPAPQLAMLVFIGLPEPEPVALAPPFARVRVDALGASQPAHQELATPPPQSAV